MFRVEMSSFDRLRPLTSLGFNKGASGEQVSIGSERRGSRGKGSDAPEPRRGDQVPLADPFLGNPILYTFGDSFPYVSYAGDLNLAIRNLLYSIIMQATRIKQKYKCYYTLFPFTEVSIPFSLFGGYFEKDVYLNVRKEPVVLLSFYVHNISFFQINKK